MFAVNGAAKPFFASIDPIWRDDPEVPGWKVSIDKVLTRGLGLCS